MELSTEIKEVRATLGLSQSQAAKAWGLNVATLQTWEQGIRSPRGLSLEMLRLKMAASLAAAKPASPPSASPEPPASPPKQKRSRRRQLLLKAKSRRKP